MEFFATSHGKSECDVIGGTVKREAARTSLRATTTGHILTPQQIFESCSIHITGIKSFYIPKDDVAFNSKFLEKRFNNSSKFSGIRIYHCFIHNSDKTRMQRISGDKNTDEIIMSVHKSRRAANDSDLEDLTLGQFLLCTRYETDLWIGNVKELSFENEDALVSFMHQKVPSINFHWPIREDVC